MKQILLATKNPGKILEYREIFKEFNLPFELLTLKDVNIQGDPVEDGKTFEENAIKKADYYSQFSKLPLLAEDSGLEIDCLNGEPGVYSRRWSGHEATDEELLQILFEKMKGVPQENRGAQFRVILAFKYSDKEPKLSEGVLRGTIAEKPSSNMIPGFPFRSLFYVESFGKILGELTMNEEAKVAHRRIALSGLIPELNKIGV
jgi:XTP/dITP diphosphohydrolase